MKSPLDLNYWILGIGVVLGAVQLYWGMRLSGRDGDLKIISSNGTGWAPHIKLILGGMTFLLGSIAVILVKLFS
jgi:hypothetical protein